MKAIGMPVGPDACQHLSGTVGRFGVGETNDRGWRLREFAKSHRLSLANTLHPHKLSTHWHAPNGHGHNQIDFILTPQRFKPRIDEANTKFTPGADIGSDHDLVLTTIKLKLKTKHFTKSPCIRFDLEKLTDPTIAEVFHAKAGGKFAAICILSLTAM